MEVGETFQAFVGNLAIVNDDVIASRYGEITVALNKKFRDTESKSDNCLQVGSYGRWTAIKNVSDLDMLYIMPKSKWDDYKENKQSKLLNDTKDAIKGRYPKTEVRVDRLVVCVVYKDFRVEVQPVFEQDDGSFKYPDTYDGGSWKITKPRDEISEASKTDKLKNQNFRRLCKMARAWKNKHGVGMGGLLVDTLANNYLKSMTDYDAKSFYYYDEMCRDFFKFLSDEPDKDRYAALGSGQHVKVKTKFQSKAKKAYDLTLKAIAAQETDAANAKWKKVFGSLFPSATAQTEDAAILNSERTWTDTEQYIDDQFPVDIRFELKIECEVSQNGFREHSLAEMLRKGIRLYPKKSLMFSIGKIDVPVPYTIYWKVLNRGSEAERRDCIRGQIFQDRGYYKQREDTLFTGAHVVDCYAVKDGVVVAKDRVHVPIS